MVREAERVNRRVHIITDGMNFKRICTKRDDKGLPDPSISGGEVRTAYKHRWRLKRRIYFYYQGRRTLAPWDKTPFAAHFAHFDQNRILKTF